MNFNLWSSRLRAYVFRIDADCKSATPLSRDDCGVYVYIIEAENSAGQKVRRSGKIAVVK
ncbi:hypothetical protein FJZ31_18580 [Candidatus Poribacteria bacterium]|nr:hypothetical protein [Candidatus Poribacteria bacterium]